MRKAAVTLILILSLIPLQAQTLSQQDLPLPSDSIIRSHHTASRIGRSLGLGFTSNLSFFLFNRFVTQEEFAKISINSIKTNLKSPLVWDSDKFFTNMWGHPYQGSHYFSAGRVNGFNYYQSIPYAAFGSLFWEYFTEIEPPSINDFITTTAGGMSLGEIAFRLADHIYDNRASGRERTLREITATLIAPMYGINRWATGTHRTPGKGNLLPTFPIEGHYGGGARLLRHNDDTKNYGITLHGELTYGDLDDNITCPYDWFQGSAQVDLIDRYVILTQFNVVGALRTWQIAETRDHQISAGLFQPFTYFQTKMPIDQPNETHPFYLSESAALGAGVITHTQTPQLNITSQLYINGILLGTTVSDNIRIKHRDYNYGSGFSLKLRSDIHINNKLNLRLIAENYHLYSRNKYNQAVDFTTMTPDELLHSDYRGDHSHANLYYLGASASYAIGNHLHLALDHYRYIRHSHYRHYSNVRDSARDNHLTLRYHF